MKISLSDILLVVTTIVSLVQGIDSLMQILERLQKKLETQLSVLFEQKSVTLGTDFFICQQLKKQKKCYTFKV